MTGYQPKDDRQQVLRGRTIVIVDVEGFGAPPRDDRHRALIRAGLYSVLTEAFEKADIDWSGCQHADLADGVLILAPPQQPKSRFAEELPGALITTLKNYNVWHPDEEKMRLRLRSAQLR